MYLKCTNRNTHTAAGPRTSSWEHLLTAVPRHLERNTRTTNRLCTRCHLSSISSITCERTA